MIKLESFQHSFRTRKEAHEFRGLLYFYDSILYKI